MGRIYIILYITLTFFCGSIFAQEQAKPHSGEGIYAFLKRHKRNESGDYDKFVSLNKNKLGKEHNLKKHFSYILPPLSSSVGLTAVKPTEVKGKKKLFGTKYEEYTIKSSLLKGACFFLSSGHGGPDSGAIGIIDGHNVHEDEYAYDITLRLARSLLEEGATVHMIIQDADDGIRDDTYLKNNKDETCMGETIPLNQLARLKQRSDKINTLYKKSNASYKRAVFIHLDSRSRKKQLDVFFYHAPKSNDGIRLAKTMRSTFKEQYAKHQPNRGFSGTVSARDLYVLKNTNPVGLFAELGNIQNNFDQRRFLNYDNRQALANWLCRGFITDYENSKKK